MTARDFTSSRAKIATFLLISLILTAADVYFLSRPGQHDWRATLGLLIFGLCSAVFAVLMVRPRRLELDAHGFTLSGGLSRTPKTTAWAEIEPFFILQLPRGGKMIGYARKGQARSIASYTRSPGLASADGMLPSLWSQSLEQVVEDLNAYRAAALLEQGSGA